MSHRLSPAVSKPWPMTCSKSAQSKARWDLQNEYPVMTSIVSAEYACFSDKCSPDLRESDIPLTQHIHPMRDHRRKFVGRFLREQCIQSRYPLAMLFMRPRGADGADFPHAVRDECIFIPWIRDFSVKLLVEVRIEVHAIQRAMVFAKRVS